MIISPIHRHQGGVWRIGGGTFDGHLTALGIVVHVILTAAPDCIPHIAVDDAIVEGAHIQGVLEVDIIGVFVTDQLPPFIVGMERLVGIPGIVHHLRAGVEVGRHGKGGFPRQIHHPKGFVLIIIAVGVRTVVKIGIVAVQVHVVGVAAARPSNRMVAAIIGAIGVGAG